MRTILTRQYPITPCARALEATAQQVEWADKNGRSRPTDWFNGVSFTVSQTYSGSYELKVNYQMLLERNDEIRIRAKTITELVPLAISSVNKEHIPFLREVVYDAEDIEAQAPDVKDPAKTTKESSYTSNPEPRSSVLYKIKSLRGIKFYPDEIEALKNLLATAQLGPLSR